MKNDLSRAVTGRIDIADVLRGFAVMGIVVLHSIEHYNFYSFPAVTSEWFRFTDKLIWDSMFFTFGGKAYAIFALLFGLSFFIQDDKQMQKGKDFRGRFAWRLVLLFVFGNINAMFFTAEILVLYSIIGFVLIAVCRLSTRLVLIIAAFLMLQPIACWELTAALFNPDYVPIPEKAGYYFGKIFLVQTHGSFGEMIKTNLWDGQLASLTWAWEHGRMFQTASLFMVGMLIGRMKLFTYTEWNIQFWFKTWVIALLVFFPLNGLVGLLPQFIEMKTILTPLLLILTSLANLSFMLVLLSGIILLFYRTKLTGVFMKLSPYGRMSLTNYIMQSVMGSMLFYGWGFALHQHLGVTPSFLVGVGLFVLQFLFCRWWMSCHKQGPLEGLWKKATWIKF